MLDELSAACLVRPIYCVLGSDFFTSKTEANRFYSYDLRHIQKLLRFQGMGRLLFASADAEDHLIYDQLNDRFGLHFATLVSRETMSVAQMKQTVQAADLVYAPAFCKSQNIQPVLTPPSSAERLLFVLEYFSTTGVPFSAEEYKRILV